jgi:hypothetical protein
MSGRGRNIIVVVGCHSRDKVLEGINEGLLVGHVAALIGARVSRRDGGRSEAEGFSK